MMDEGVRREGGLVMLVRLFLIVLRNYSNVSIVVDEGKDKGMNFD